MTTEAERLRRAAETLGASLRAESRRVICTVPGPVLAGAVDQVSASTGHDPDIPVLNGVHMETGSGCVRLTATDRYRLATRTLVPTDPTCPSWAGTLAGDDLLLDIRGTDLPVTVRSADDGDLTTLVMPRSAP
ncbi:hypothetical protein [Rhodococcus gordoniae]|nr:hypothetical protein [Rhodococcus gordoniae]